MRQCIALLLTFASLSMTSLVHADQLYGFAMVNDKDGYVNLREDASLQSAIIQRLPNKTVVSANCLDFTSNKNFCFIITDATVTGFVYKNRLVFFEDNKRLLPIASTHSNNPLSAYFASDHHPVSVQIDAKPIMIYPSKFSDYNHANQACPYYYDNVCSFGLEGFDSTINQPEQYYQLSQVVFKVKNKTIKVDEQDLSGLFISEHEVAYDDVFKRTDVYFDPITSHLYLLSLQSDGAGTYTFVYEVDTEGRVTRHVWSEAV